MGPFIKMIIDLLETAVQAAFRSGLTLPQVRSQMIREFGGLIQSQELERIIIKIATELKLMVALMVQI